MKSTPDVMTVAELAERLGVCQNTVCKGIRKGQLPGAIVGDPGKPRYVIPRRLVEQFLGVTDSSAPAPLVSRRAS